MTVAVGRTTAASWAWAGRPLPINKEMVANAIEGAIKVRDVGLYIIVGATLSGVERWANSVLERT